MFVCSLLTYFLYLHLVSRLRLIETIRVLRLYAFMVWIGKTLPLTPSPVCSAEDQLDQT